MRGLRAPAVLETMSNPAEIPGIRVLRLLVEQAGVQTLLVRLGEEPDAVAGQLVRGTSPAGARRVGRLIGALDRAAGMPQVVELLDVTADEHGPAVVVEHLRGRRLHEVLAVRERWAAGEAVAVLSPLVRALATLHEWGVAHGEWGASAVVLAERGPVIDGFQNAELFAVGAPEVVRAEVAAVARDRDAVRGVALDVLARVEGARGAAAREVIAGLSAVAPDELFAWLSRSLDELAAPVEVRPADPAPRTEVANLDTPVRGATAPGAGTEDAAPAQRLPELVGRLVGAGLAARIDELWGAAAERLSRLSTARRRLVIAGGAAVIAAAVMMALVPGTPSASPTHDALAADPALAAEHSEAERTDAPDAPATDVLSDDPAVAVVELLERREGCFRELSLLCLEGVNQSGSAASADDRAALETLRAGGEAPRQVTEVGEPRIVERLGDSVLIELGPDTAPASLLVMRSEAGWRIRDWVAVPSE